MATKRERTTYNREWRASHVEELRQRGREYRAKNRERIEAYTRAWHERYPEKKRQYAAKCRDASLAQQRQRYATDEAFRQRSLERARQQRKDHPDQTARGGAKYRQSTKGIINRRTRELKAYGLTWEAYLEMYDRQGGACAICKRPETKRGKDRTDFLTVDHDHETNRVRGLLCRSCNRGLGLLGDTAESIARVVAYLSEADRGKAR